MSKSSSLCFSVLIIPLHGSKFESRQPEGLGMGRSATGVWKLFIMLLGKLQRKNILLDSFRLSSSVERDQGRQHYPEGSGRVTKK